MLNVKMFWVLVAPGLASCFCFFLERIPQWWRRGFELIGRFGAPLW